MNIEELLVKQTQTVGSINENNLVFVRNKNLQAILNRFDKEEHRLETVTKFQGITFINDAKATSINATYYSFETIKQKIIWITQGKNIDYNELFDFISKKVKAIVCIGNENKKLIQTFSTVISTIYEKKNMEDAVFTAFYAAEPDDTILFSPAYKNEDENENFKKLGLDFKNAIAQL
jgi:UDP-N-acetylmuramoylalanine--D-glutamate ligase